MGNNSFATYASPSTYFIVKNVSPQNKVIRIFNYPILMNAIRDLMKIPGIGESDIATSLLKGEIRFKILALDIIIVSSDINALPFNPTQLKFLQVNGMNVGTNISNNQQEYTFIQNVILYGNIDGNNKIFICPNNVTVVNINSIVIYWNGIKQVINIDYSIYGYGTELNSVILAIPPNAGDTITADYYIKN